MAERVNKESMPCNRPRPANDGKHKRVVKACSGGKEKIVRYGAKGYSSNYSAEARKQYRRRHAGEGSASKLTAGYWAYHDLWSPGSKVYREGKSSGVGERFKKKSVKKALNAK
jgi:hypothetical protein